MELTYLIYLLLGEASLSLFEKRLQPANHLLLHNEHLDDPLDLEASLIHLFAPQNEEDDVFSSRLLIVIDDV